MSNLRIPALRLRFIATLTLAGALIAQGYLYAEQCTDEGVCIPDPISLPFYCSGDDTASLELGLNTNFDIQFTATLNRKTPTDRFEMYALNGNTSIDGSNEVRVAPIKCSYNKDSNTSTCTGILTLEKEAKLAETFNFEQAVIDFVFRRGRSTFCIGKLTNNEELLTQNGLEQRAFCSVGNLARKRAPEVSGFGFFDPRGYGTDGESHLHLSVTGLPEKQKLHACIPTKKSYTSAFSFSAYSAEDTDQSIYGDLDEEEGNKLSAEATSYSYDLWRTVVESANPSALFSKTLSQINRQVSPPSASSGRTSTTSSLTKRLSDSKNSKKRKRNKNSKKGASTKSVDALGAKSKSKIFDWLSFDPLSGNSFYLATDCNKNTPEKAFARVSCSKDPAAVDGAECATPSAGDAVTLKICRTNDSLTPMTIRVTGLAPASYYVCTDGQALAGTLDVNATDSSSYGELNVTDSEAIKAVIDSYAISKSPLAEIQSVTIGTTEDCSNPVASGSF
ncbi:MAG: hypothetical protein KDD62_00475 [Bdellovibrionales bacterium]|nr:hypothetical protein [Bdellovibrionales bacterium]